MEDSSQDGLQSVPGARAAQVCYQLNHMTTLSCMVNFLNTA